MTCSRERNNEWRIYLDACQELNRRRALGDDDAVSDLLDELTAIGRMTTWPKLQRACRQTVASARGEIAAAHG